MIRILPFIYNYLIGKAGKATKLVVLTVFFLMQQTIGSFGQNLSGQWIGGFGTIEESGGRKTNYVLEMEFSGTKISGYSYTYFAISGKQYFVICKLSGTYDKGSKSMIVSEVEKIKSNTPPDFENCLQSHQLTYLKQKDKEVLVGKWKPYIKESNCGNGLTELERRKLEKITPEKKEVVSTNASTKKPSQVQPKTNATATNKSIEKNKSGVVQPLITQKNNTASAGSKPTPKTDHSTSKTTLSPEKPAQNQKNPSAPLQPAQSLLSPSQHAGTSITEKKQPIKSVQESQENRIKPILNKSNEKYNRRSYEVIKTIEVVGQSIQIEIYDNGQIDGDTVSIFLNEKLLVPKKMLTANPITLNIKLEDENSPYDLIMFAESLGSIPPNTAFMLITTSTSRYEINISSTEQTSGAIRFKLKK